MEYEFQKEAFVGKKYEKIMNQKFSIPTFLFGSLYWAYRKMLLEACGLLVVKTILNLILSKIALSIADKAFANNPSMDSAITTLISMIIVLLIISVTLGIFSGFIFRPVYEKFVNRRVRKIIDKDVSDTESEEIEKCRKKGGTSILFLILFLVISSSITGMIYGNSDTNNGNSLSNGSYGGYLDTSKKQVNLENVFEIDIPDVFEKSDDYKSSEYHYNYINEDNTENQVDIFGDGSSDKSQLPESKLSIFVLDAYDTVDDFMKDAQKKWGTNGEIFKNDDIKYGTIIDNFENTGYYVIVDTDLGALYLEYDISEKALDIDECKNYFVSIASSLKLKDKSGKIEKDKLESAFNVKTSSNKDDDKDSDEDEKKSEKDSKKSNSKTKEISYEEYKYKIFTDVKISDYIDVDVSNAFKENNENDYMLDYYHDENLEKDIQISIAQIDADGAKKFITDLTNKNGLSTTEDMYSADVNDIKWYIVGFMLDNDIIYYNAFEKDDKVFLYRYQISDSVEDENLKGSYEDIIYSIKYIDKEKKEVEKSGNIIDEDNDTSSNKSDNTNTSNENTSNTSSDEDDDENTNTTNKNTNTTKSNNNTNTNSTNTSITITPTNVTYNNAN